MQILPVLRLVLPLTTLTFTSFTYENCRRPICFGTWRNRRKVKP